MITQSYARELFNYDPDTGKLTWKRKFPNHMKVGDEAGSLQYGYRRSVRIDGKPHPVSSVIWVWYHGYWPKGHPVETVDHIDRNPLNNRITNLRLVTAKQNNQNKGVYRNSPFGISGVTWHKATGKYLVRFNGAHIGVFTTLEEATEARKKAEAR